MKKLTLFVGLICSAFLSTAQVSGWYDFGAGLQTGGFDVDYYRTHIHRDSTVLVDYSGGLGAVWMHGIGQVLDPTSMIFSLGSVNALNEEDAYTVDSIGFSYRYFRPQDSIPDTLVIQFYKQENMANMYEDPWGTGVSYARVAYDTLTYSGADPFMEIIKILDINDTASGSRYMSFAIEEDIAAGEIVAASYVFLSGNSYNIGDTLDVEFDPTPTNQINDFIGNYYIDNSKLTETGIYNHAIIATDAARYNITINNWQGQFWPGTAPYEINYHSNISFHLTAETVGINKAISADLGFKIFQSGSSSRLEITADKNDVAEIQLHDLAGNLLLSKSVLYQKGTTQLSIATGSLSQGLYIVSLTDSSNRLAQKIVIR